jgi:hypothetical protein
MLGISTHIIYNVYSTKHIVDKNLAGNNALKLEIDGLQCRKKYHYHNCFTNLILIDMATIKQSWSLEQFKTVRGIATLEIFTSKASGKKYVTDKATGEYIGMLAPDFDSKKHITVMSMADEDTKETWLFICNAAPRVAEDTL